MSRKPRARKARRLWLWLRCSQNLFPGPSSCSPQRVRAFLDEVEIAFAPGDIDECQNLVGRQLLDEYGPGKKRAREVERIGVILAPNQAVTKGEVPAVALFAESFQLAGGASRTVLAENLAKLWNELAITGQLEMMKLLGGRAGPLQNFGIDPLEVDAQLQ